MSYVVELRSGVYHAKLPSGKSTETDDISRGQKYETYAAANVAKGMLSKSRGIPVKIVEVKS